MSSIIDSCVHNFNDVKSIILDFCNREDKRDVGRFVVMTDVLWKNRINVVCNNVREEVSKIRLQTYFNWQDWFSTQKESGIDNVSYHLQFSVLLMKGAGSVM